MISLMQIPNGQRRRQIIYGHYVPISTSGGLSLQIGMNGKAKNERWNILKIDIIVE